MGGVIEVHGMDELTKSLDALVRKYPDKAGVLLQREGRKIRKSIVDGYRSETEGSGTSKRSLKKIGSYSVSKVQGIGMSQYVEIKGKSPHFHLVENGHVQLNRQGQAVGFVQGKHITRETAKEYEGKLPEAAQRMIDELIKESKL